MSPPWQIDIETDWPEGNDHRLAFEVDPRKRIVRLGPRVEGANSLEVQSGAVARSFFDVRNVSTAAASEWLRGEEAAALLEILAAGFTCDVLWSGDPVVTWSDTAWEAGSEMIQTLARLLPDG